MKHGFTLIELLVVIAIIGILSAMLFPVFAKARESARKITCASNMLQIGKSIFQYSQDADDQLPQTVDVIDVKCDSDAWAPLDVAQLASLPTALQAYISPKSPLFVCPSASAQRDDDNYRACSVNVADYANYSSYIMNTSVFLAPTPPSTTVDLLRCRFHGGEGNYASRRYQVLLSDGAVRSMTRSALAQIQAPQP